MTDAQSMIEVHSKVSDTTYNAEYGTNQPHLKRDTRAKCKKTCVTRMHLQKSNFARTCVCYLNQLLNRYTVLDHCQ